MPTPVSRGAYRSACIIHENGLYRLVSLLASTAPNSSLLGPPSMQGAAVRSAPAQPLVNHALCRSGKSLPYQLPLLRSAYIRAGIRSWTLWIHHGDLPDAAAALKRFGLKQDEDVPAMLLNARKLRRAVRPSLDYDSDSGDLRTLGIVNEAAYPTGVGMAIALDGAPYDNEAFRVYRAWSGGKVVSALLTVDDASPDGTDCGFYFVATLPSARRQNFARRLMLAALADASERGCTSASLQASPMGQPLYSSLGFRTVFQFRTFQCHEPEPAQP